MVICLILSAKVLQNSFILLLFFKNFFSVLLLSFPDFTCEHSKLSVFEFHPNTKRVVKTLVILNLWLHLALIELRVDESWNAYVYDSGPLGDWVAKVQLFNVLDAKDQIVRQRLEQIGLVVQCEVLGGVAAEDHQSV